MFLWVSDGRLRVEADHWQPLIFQDKRGNTRAHRSQKCFDWSSQGPVPPDSEKLLSGVETPWPDVRKHTKQRFRVGRELKL